MRWGRAVLLACGLVLSGSALAGSRLEVRITGETIEVPRYGLFEASFRNEASYANPFFDAALDVVFKAPSGKRYKIGGFHCGSSVPPRIEVKTVPGDHHDRKEVSYHFDRRDLWKARFSPPETGRWEYRWTMSDVKGGRASGRGNFVCVAGAKSLHGFLRIDPRNRFRFVHDDGTPFFPAGLQECWGDGDGTGSALSRMSMEGPFRNDRPVAWGRLPRGPMFVQGEGIPQNGDVYFRTFADCGFNLFRFSQSNCSFALYNGLDNYLVQEAAMTDEILLHTRRYGFRTIYGIFGYQGVFGEHPDEPKGMAKVKRFVQYSVNRWGALTDIWEFLNEQKADKAWYEIMAPYLRSIDPYRHPITTSWERPELKEIEVNAPHWYQFVDARSRAQALDALLNADRYTADEARKWRGYGKPVIVGEAGNSTDAEKRKAGDLLPEYGGVWDPESAERMRVRNWTGLFNEVSFVFWVTSYARDGHFMNIWLGAREREFVRAMQDFARRLGGDVRPVPVEASAPEEVRAYGLASKTRAGAYLRRFTDREEPVKDLRVRIGIPVAATVYWYSPADASIAGKQAVEPGEHSLQVPPFTADIALLVTPDSPPDIDHDGLPNDLDEDDDNDGVADARDAFPLDASEWADADADLIGDNQDADDDGDGRADDRDRDGVPDNEEKDIDGDGVPGWGAVPWDAFPLDPAKKGYEDGDQ